MEESDGELVCGSSNEGEEVDGESVPDSLSSGVDGEFLFDDISDEEYIPSTSQESPSSSSSSPSQEQGSEPVSGQTRKRGRCHSTSTSSHTHKKVRGTPTTASDTGWQTKKLADMLPEPLTNFLPARTPGVQENLLSSDLSPSELFKRFIDEKSVNTICNNTNKHAEKKINEGKQSRWCDISLKDFYKFVGLLLYMAILKLPRLSQYWRQNSIFTILAPALVMSRGTFQAILWNLHMSDTDEENDNKKVKAEYDPLQRLRPLYDHLRNAFKKCYHPRQNVAIDERTVSTKAKYRMYQYIGNKYDVKLFVLTDCSNGYTCDFSVHAGRYQNSSKHGLGYDAVIGMMNQNDLGTGYHLYCDSFFTSPELFMELLSLEVHACGTYRDHRMETVIQKKDKRGTIRWMRDGPLLFVKWMDKKPVTMCSTIHTVYSGGMAKRNVKDEDGQLKLKQIPMPAPVVDYNKYRACLDPSDPLTKDYSVHRRSKEWHKLLFQHFIDIVATNSFVIHKELSQIKGKQPMTHSKFLETLISELCGISSDMIVVPPNRRATTETLFTPNSQHPAAKSVIQTCYPVAIKPDANKLKKATEGSVTVCDIRQELFC